MNISDELHISWWIATDRWGHFGDFIGGFLGTLVSVGSALLLYETIHYQSKIQRLNNLQRQKDEFERLFFNQLDYLSILSKEIMELEINNKLWWKVSLEKLMAQLQKDVLKIDDSEKNDNQAIKLIIHLNYLLIFGKANHYSDLKLDKKISEILRVLEITFPKTKREFDWTKGDGGFNSLISNLKNEYLRSLTNEYTFYGRYLRNIFGTFSLLSDHLTDFGYDYCYNLARRARARLTSEEQVLIMLNSFSEPGQLLNSDPNNEGSLFGKFDIIRNIPQDYFEGISLSELFPQVHFEWQMIESEASVELKKNLKTKYPGKF